jgi:hypothetical protein
VHVEHSLIGAFVKRSKRDRYREILSNPRLRRKFTDQLAHFTDFDPKYRLPIPSDKLFVDNIARELQKRNSPNIVYVISEDPALDQKELPLIEALKRTVGRGMGTVQSCIPRRLAFVETEDERFILERHDVGVDQSLHSASVGSESMGTKKFFWGQAINQSTTPSFRGGARRTRR